MKFSRAITAALGIANLTTSVLGATETDGSISSSKNTTNGEPVPGLDFENFDDAVEDEASSGRTSGVFLLPFALNNFITGIINKGRVKCEFGTRDCCYGKDSNKCCIGGNSSRGAKCAPCPGPGCPFNCQSGSLSCQNTCSPFDSTCQDYNKSPLACPGPNCPEPKCPGPKCPYVCPGPICNKLCPGPKCPIQCPGPNCPTSCPGPHCPVPCTGPTCGSIKCPAQDCNLQVNGRPLVFLTKLANTFVTRDPQNSHNIVYIPSAAGSIKLSGPADLLKIIPDVDNYLKIIVPKPRDRQFKVRPDKLLPDNKDGGNGGLPFPSDIKALIDGGFTGTGGGFDLDKFFNGGDGGGNQQTGGNPPPNTGTSQQGGGDFDLEKFFNGGSTGQQDQNQGQQGQTQQPWNPGFGQQGQNQGQQGQTQQPWNPGFGQQGQNQGQQGQTQQPWNPGFGQQGQNQGQQGQTQQPWNPGFGQQGQNQGQQGQIQQPWNPGFGQQGQEQQGQQTLNPGFGQQGQEQQGQQTWNPGFGQQGQGQIGFNPDLIQSGGLVPGQQQVQGQPDLSQLFNQPQGPSQGTFNPSLGNVQPQGQGVPDFSTFFGQQPQQPPPQNQGNFGSPTGSGHEISTADLKALLGGTGGANTGFGQPQKQETKRGWFGRKK